MEFLSSKQSGEKLDEKKAVVVVKNETQQEGEGEDDEDVAPIDRIIIPSDIVDINENDDYIFIVGTQGSKVTKIGGIENMPNLKELCLRSNLLSNMNGIETCTLLEKLELYDNHISALTDLENLNNLKILDISYNVIRDMSLVSCCPLLEEIYILHKINYVQYLV